MADYQSLNDQELIDFLKAGDHAAFTEIYNRHWKFLYSKAYNTLRNQGDCMDVCQSVFLWVWENRITIHIKVNLRGYLYTAVKYKIANLIRQGKVTVTLFDDVIKALPNDETNELEIKELKCFIGQIINDLPEKCRQVFLLSRDEHLSHKQISDRLGISEKTVDDHITRALKKMRAPLGRFASIWLML
jgi:RNA polymerase sigma-70 factor (family 1)